VTTSRNGTTQGLDPYKILQVDPSAHPEIVRAAYRTLLRSLGKHPDLGGSDSEARTIIEAYEILSDPERRRAYDQWLRAHSAPAAAPADPAPPSPLSPAVVNWIRLTLPEFRNAPGAPFARSFDLVLEGPQPFAPRLYVKGYPIITRTNWPTIFVLCRAVGVARRAVLPSTDAVLLVSHRVQDLRVFLDAAVGQSAQWAWNRSVIGVCTLSPLTVHAGHITLAPSVLRRLRVSAERNPFLAEG
jgi:hypothetical protein